MTEKEEYHLPEDEKTEEYSEQAYSSTTENIRSILMNRRVQMMLGGVIVLTLIMMFASWGSKTPPPEKEKPADSSDKVKLDDVPEAKHTVVDHSDDINELRMNLESKLNDTEQQLRSAQITIDELKKEEEDMKRNYDNQISDLKDQLDELMAKLDKPEEKKPEVVEKKPEPKPIPKDYRLRAMIDGRAWLGYDGTKTITVKKGDSLDDDYWGNVKGIYPSEGRVTTTTNREIHFNTHAN